MIDDLVILTMAGILICIIGLTITAFMWFFFPELRDDIKRDWSR